MNFKLTADGAAAVSLVATWVKVGPATPQGTMLWLINKPSRVSFKGHYKPSDPFPTHWFPNPDFDKDEDEKAK